MRLSLFEVSNQREALRQLALLTQRSTVHPDVVRAARQITAECDARDDRCELEAIYNAVKHGTSAVPGLERGVRYVADSRWADHFTAPARLLEMCRDGACGEDCDGHAALIAALAGAIGFKTGLRAYSPPNSQEYEHVYAVAMFPKRPPFSGYVALDTTVPRAKPGWEPPNGKALTAWL